MRKLYKATTVMGVSTFVGMVIGFVRAKFLALTLGPSGVGILSQALTFVQTAETICGLGIGIGITKYVAELWRKDDIEGIKHTIFGSLVLQAACFFAFFIGVVIFQKPLSVFVFSSPEYSWILVLVSLAVFFTISCLSFEATILGMGKPELFSKARIIYYALGLIMLLVFVGSMKLYGGFIYVFVNALVSFAVLLVLLGGVLKIKLNISPSNLVEFIKRQRCFDNSKVLSYGGVMLFSSFIAWFSILYVRSLLVKFAGADANGYYQVIFSLVSYYTPFFSNGIWGYLFPKLSSLEDTVNYGLELNKALRFILVFLVPAVSLVYIFKKVIVLILFSNEFLPSIELFKLYLLGSFFFMASFIFGTSLLAKKKLKAYFLFVLAGSLLSMIMVLFTVRSMGVMSVALSYLTVNALLFAGYYLYHSRSIGICLSRRNVVLFIAGLAVICVVLFVPGNGIFTVAAKIGLLVFWLFGSIDKREVSLLKGFFKF